MRQTKKPSSSNSKPKVIAIIGTTASGKSDIALRLAKKYKGIIIASDARTLYKSLNIGTAKPTKTEQKQVPHYMLDLITPRQRYSAQRFQKEVYKIVKAHAEQPIFLVGGNGLYVDAVLKGHDFAGTKPDPKLRKKLLLSDLSALIRKLKKIDPAGYKQVDLKNKRRVVRALEVKLTTGQSLFKIRTSNPPDWDILKIGLSPAREVLKQRITDRITKMLRAGWLAEVASLLKKYPRTAPGFSSHGYPELIAYFKKEITKEEATQKIVHNVWVYSKRQLRWFQRDKEIVWLKPTDFNKSDKLVKTFLRK